MVAPGDLGFGLARMFEALSDPSEPEVRVFRDLSEARTWLGTDPAED